MFAEQLSYYFVANGIDDADKKRAVLLSACGAATYKLLNTLVAPAELTTKSFAELVQLAKEHYTVFYLGFLVWGGSCEVCHH